MDNRTRQQSWDYGLVPGEAFEPADDESTFDRALPHVMTVLGPIDPAALGVTLHHEHVFARLASADADEVIDDPHRKLVALEEYYQAGGRSIVDRSTADVGRDIETIGWIAARSPVNVIVATGNQQLHCAPPAFQLSTAEQFAAEMVGELKEGIAGTGVRAGIIAVCMCSIELTEVDDRVLRAAAWAQLETGAPISISSDDGSIAIEQLAVLREEGAETTHVIVGHMDSSSDMASMRKVLEAGAFASFDRIAWDYAGKAVDRAVMLKQLVDAGFGDQLLLSAGVEHRSMQPADGGAPGWSYAIEEFPLALMEQAMGAMEIRRILVENAARALTTRPPSRHIP